MKNSVWEYRCEEEQGAYWLKTVEGPIPFERSKKHSNLVVPGYSCCTCPLLLANSASTTLKCRGVDRFRDRTQPVEVCQGLLVGVCLDPG